MARRRPNLVLALAAAICAGHAEAFPHVVQPGDTLAGLAERYYGEVERERLLVAANALDLPGVVGGGVRIVAGMRLEIPAVGHHRTNATDTWEALATRLLGGGHRAALLARANGTSPWLAPAEGTEIVVPYNLPVVLSLADSTASVARRWLGDPDLAWELDHYNGLRGRQPGAGELLLVPLVELPLTDEGRARALQAAAETRAQGGGGVRELQRRVDAEIPTLLAEVRAGRYADAISRGTRLSSTPDLPRATRARIERLLLEAWAAYDAPGLAAAACTSWRALDPEAVVDPVWMSPKLVRACESSG